MSQHRTDRDYYRRREGEALRMAQETQESWVAAIHRRLAQNYAERAAVAESMIGDGSIA